MCPSLQLQAHDPIPETATYGALRPYRESPLLARARRTESFHSYREFQNTLGKGLLELNGQSALSLGATAGGAGEARRSLGEGGDNGEKRGVATELWAGQGPPDPPKLPPPPDSPGDARRKAPPLEEESGAESRQEARKKGAFDGSFLARKRGPPIPQLASLPSSVDTAGSDSSSTASPSPTKMSTSPRHRRGADPPGPEYGL